MLGGHASTSFPLDCVFVYAKKKLRFVQDGRRSLKSELAEKKKLSIGGYL